MNRDFFIPALDNVDVTSKDEPTRERRWITSRTVGKYANRFIGYLSIYHF